MDSMIGLSLPDQERLSARVGVVRGLNPGLFTGPGTNTYLLGDGGRPLLLDTGAGREDYAALLARVLTEDYSCDRPEEVLVTHAHPDHLGGAESLLQVFGEYRARKLPWPGRDERYAIEIDALSEGDVIRAAGVTLHAFHMPGHAEDHLCFYLEEERALFTGDVILGAGTSVIPVDGGDMKLYLETLRRIANLDLARIYPGHGAQIDEPTARVRAYIQHRGEREGQIIEAIEAGASSVNEIVARIYQDTPRALHPAAAQSVLSHLVSLEREQRASRSSDASGAEHWAIER